MERAKPILLATAVVGLAGMAAPAWAQNIDQAAVESACGALEREALSGRARIVDVVACANREAARQLNPQMPLRVDELTTVQSVVAAGPMLQYNLRVDLDASSVTDEGRAGAEQSTRSNVCAARDMRQTIANGGSYTYVWSDRNGRLIHRALIDRC